MVAVAAAALVLHGRGSDPRSGLVAVASAAGEIGNGRPAITRYDGLMVRRCTALAVYLGPGGNADTVRTALHTAADQAALPLIDLPPGVLSPATLEVQVPEVVGCLPAGATVADAGRVLPGLLPGEAHGSVETVLVHDLRFDVRTGAVAPYDVARALDREGVLADVLGRFDVDLPAAGLVRVHYTGPLLADDEVEVVRAALARGADIPVSAVTVAPGDPRGPGVDLRHEPTAPAPTVQTPPHHH